MKKNYMNDILNKLRKKLQSFFILFLSNLNDKNGFPYFFCNGTLF